MFAATYDFGLKGTEEATDLADPTHDNGTYVNSWEKKPASTPNIGAMKESTPRPNVSAEELRRDFQVSDPASRIRQGIRLSRFGNRLRLATQAAKLSQSARP